MLGNDLDDGRQFVGEVPGQLHAEHRIVLEIVGARVTGTVGLKCRAGVVGGIERRMRNAEGAEATQREHLRGVIRVSGRAGERGGHRGAEHNLS